MATLCEVPLQGGNPRTLPIAALTGPEFIIADTKLYVSIATL